MPENRNLLLALVLSMAVMAVWYIFFGGPEMQQAQQQQEIAAQQQTSPLAAAAGKGTTPAATPGAATSGAATSARPPSGSEAPAKLTRAEALAQSQRVPIATGRLSGSINLTGARIDDLRLNDFHTTVDPTSPTIILLSPSGGPDAYFAEFGWIGAKGSGPYPGPKTVWSAPASAELTTTTPVTLTYDDGAGLVFKRTISVDDQYMFTVTDTVTNNGDKTVSLTPFGRIARVGEPKATSYWILHEGLIGVLGDQGLKEVKYKAIKGSHEQDFSGVTGGWLGITDKYWAATLIPGQQTQYNARFLYEAQPAPLYQTDFRATATSLAPGGQATFATRLFAGAKEVAIVDGYRDSLHIKLFDRLIDWGWFYFITKPMFVVIDFFYHLFGNFGVAILAVTVLVKAAFFPLANRSYKSMSAMKRLQPQIAEMRERYKDDKVKQQQAQMELFKKEKVNPLAGCWPVAVQIPVFFSLYKVLFVTIEMRHAPFFGWIHDLSAPDPTNVFTLFGLIPWDPSTVPGMGGFLILGAWPLIMGITMFVQMKLNPTPPDPAQAILFTWMPVIFTFMLAKFPAGLVIYWAWNNTLSVTQQYIIMRRQGVDVDLLGNITGTFRRSSRAKSAMATSAKPPPGQPQDDTESVEPQTPRKAKKANGKVKPRKAGAKARG